MARTQRIFGKALVGAALALSVTLPLAAAAAPRPRDVIFNFNGGGRAGGVPTSGLIRDAAGNFYGTTSSGGDSTHANCFAGCGAVFKLSPLGVVTALYTFKGGKDGANPHDTLIADAAGNLYGTTLGGGAHKLGTVFKLTPDGVETVLHSFAGGSDGDDPQSGLIADGAGNFYGTTEGGGPSDDGTVFKLAPDGTETVLHAFTGGHHDGAQPFSAGVIMDKHGNLYGDTGLGGAGDSGVIFKIAPNGKFSLLYSFTGGADGGLPFGGLVRDKQDNLYGATTKGGAGYGVVFKLAPGGAQTVLHTFAAFDGSTPEASLIVDKQGNLFGTTEGGGGTVFQLSPDGTHTVLHSFAGNRDRPPDGAYPKGSLLLYMNKLYGATSAGGTGFGCALQTGCGVVFEVRRAK